MLSDRVQQEAIVDRATSSLAAEFVGVFAPETVEACLRDSYRRLAESATVATYLPLLAPRFARERLQAALSASVAPGRAGVLFVCTHNSGRSQIAAAWLSHLAPKIDVWSAGTKPTEAVSSLVVEAMQEVGVDLTAAFPKPLTDEIVGAADMVVTMGCGEACPVVPGRRYEDWLLVHQPGASLDSVRAARDEIRERVETLISALRPVAT